MVSSAVIAMKSGMVQQIIELFFYLVVQVQISLTLSRHYSL